MAWPCAAKAQQAGKVPRIGFLGGSDPVGYAAQMKALHLGLGDHGYVEGKNIAIEYRWAEGNYDRLPGLAADLVHRNVAVIITQGTPAALAAKRATSTINRRSNRGQPFWSDSADEQRRLAGGRGIRWQ